MLTFSQESRSHYLVVYFSASSTTNADCNRINIYSTANVCYIRKQKTITHNKHPTQSKEVWNPLLEVIIFAASKGRNSSPWPISQVLWGPVNTITGQWWQGCWQVSPQHASTIGTERSPVLQTAICGSEYLWCTGPACSNVAPAFHFFCPFEHHVPLWKWWGSVYLFHDQPGWGEEFPREPGCGWGAHKSQDEKWL